MPEAGIPYVLTGPDGTRAVFNDPTDADFVGYLDAENGITGLLDSADVRESFDNVVEGDGTIQGNNFLGRRVGTFQGIVWPNPDMPTVNTRISKIKRASRGLKAVLPSQLTWTPSGSQQRIMFLYRQGQVKISGRRPKNFLVPMASPDPYVYAASLSQLTISTTGISGDAGFSSPITNPLTTVYQQSGQSFCVNAGDAETWPQFTIQGPITNPTLKNVTTGLSWTLTYTLGAGEILVVNSKFRTVLLGGTANRYSAYAANFATNSWWPLVAGNNDVRLLASAFSTGAQVVVSWRSAWEE